MFAWDRAGMAFPATGPQKDASFSIMMPDEEENQEPHALLYVTCSASRYYSVINTSLEAMEMTVPIAG